MIQNELAPISQATLHQVCEELNLHTEDLNEIIETVGTDMMDIREYLAKRSLNRESMFS